MSCVQIIPFLSLELSDGIAEILANLFPALVN